MMSTSTHIVGCALVLAITLTASTVMGDDSSLAKGAAAMHRSAAEKHMAAGKYTDAIEELNKAVSADSEHYMNYYKRGIARKILGKTHDALKDLGKAIDLNKESFPSGYATRGSTYLSLGMCDSALADYQKALSLDASSSEAQTGVTKSNQCSQFHAQAEEAADKQDWGRLRALITPAIQVSQDSTSLLLKRAELNYKDGHFNMVLLDTGRVIKLHHDNVNALRLRAQAYFQIGDTEVAMRHIREALRMDPDNRACMKEFKRLKKFGKAMEKGDSWLGRGAALKAIDAYKEAMSHADNNAYFQPRILLKRCEAEVRIGRGQAAVETCTNAINLDSSLIDGYLNRADAYLLDDNYQEATKDYSKAQEMDQNNRRAHEGIQKCKKLEKMASRKDYYKLLDVSKTATTREIKKAYKKMAIKHHPDKNPDDREAAEARFRDIAEAHEVLSDDNLRQRYDNGDDLQATPQNDPFGGGGFPGGFGGGGGGGGGYTFNFKFG